MSCQKPLVCKLKLAGGKNSIIPNGVTEELLIEVIDERASFHFNNPITTRAFMISSIKDGYEATYIERLQKTVVKYPRMMQKELMKDIMDTLSKLAGKEIKV